MTLIDRKEPLPRAPSPRPAQRAAPSTGCDAAQQQDVATSPRSALGSDPRRVPLPASESSGRSTTDERRRTYEQEEAERYVFAHDTANQARIAPPPSYGSIIREEGRRAGSFRSSGRSSYRRGSDSWTGLDDDPDDEEAMDHGRSSRRSHRAFRPRRRHSPEQAVSSNDEEEEEEEEERDAGAYDADIGPTERSHLLDRARQWAGGGRRRRRKDKKPKRSACVQFLRILVVIVLLIVIITELLDLLNPDRVMIPPQPYLLGPERGAELLEVVRFGPPIDADQLQDSRIPPGQYAVRQELVLDMPSRKGALKNFLFHTVGLRYDGQMHIEDYYHPWIRWQNSTNRHQASVNITVFASSHHSLENVLTLAKVRTADAYEGYTLASDGMQWAHPDRDNTNLLIDIALPILSRNVSIDLSSDTMDIVLGASTAERSQPGDPEVGDRYRNIKAHTGIGLIIYKTIASSGNTSLSTVKGDFNAVGMLASQTGQTIISTSHGSLKLGALICKNLTLMSDTGPMSASLLQAQDIKIRTSTANVDMTMAPYRSVDVLTGTGDINARVIMAAVGVDPDEPVLDVPSSLNAASMPEHVGAGLPVLVSADADVPALAKKKASLLTSRFVSTLGVFNIRYDQQPATAALSSFVRSRLGKVVVQHSREFEGIVQVATQTNHMTELETPDFKSFEIDLRNPGNFTGRVFLKGNDPWGREQPSWGSSIVETFIAPIHVLF